MQKVIKFNGHLLKIHRAYLLWAPKHDFSVSINEIHFRDRIILIYIVYFMIICMISDYLNFGPTYSNWFCYQIVIIAR